MYKLKNKNGIARLVWILTAVVLILVCIILIPVIGNAGEAANKKLDKDNEQTAWDSAYMEWISRGEFEAIYDLENKRFVEEPNGVVINGYGMAKENKNKVILVKAGPDADITMEWVDPGIYTRVVK